MFTFVLLIYFCVIHIESYFIYLPSVNFTINNSTYAPKKHKLISERDTTYYLLLTTYYLLPTTSYHTRTAKHTSPLLYRGECRNRTSVRRLSPLRRAYFYFNWKAGQPRGFWQP